MNFTELFTRRFTAQPRGMLFTECLLLLAAIGYVDFLTGYEVSLSFFYSLPVIAAVWFCGIWQGAIVALLSALCWGAATNLSGYIYQHTWIGVWNCAVRFASHLLIVFGAAAVKKQIQGSKAEIKSLQGILPLCTGCKKIRDEAGYWSEIGAYIAEHSLAHPTPKLCPECARDLYLHRAAVPVHPRKAL